MARDKLSSTVVIVPGAAVELGMTDEPLGDARLRQTLKRRHMTMIALGGVIGAGLFVGSRVVIQSAGPAASISFLLTGLLVVLVMRMLGELATALPAAGSCRRMRALARAGEVAAAPGPCQLVT